MEFWKTVWIVALAGGFLGFSYISYRVITRGFSEMRDLLNQFKRDAP
jgi:hypothetical protein